MCEVVTEIRGRKSPEEDRTRSQQIQTTVDNQGLTCDEVVLT